MGEWRPVFNKDHFDDYVKVRLIGNMNVCEKLTSMRSLPLLDVSAELLSMKAGWKPDETCCHLDFIKKNICQN